MTLITAFGVTLGFFLLVIVAMAVGVLMGRRQISGSCGGLANQQDSEGNTACSLCSNPAAACKELGKRMETASSRERAEASGVGKAANADCDKDCVAEGVNIRRRCGRDDFGCWLESLPAAGFSSCSALVSARNYRDWRPE